MPTFQLLFYVSNNIHSPTLGQSPRKQDRYPHSHFIQRRTKKRDKNFFYDKYYIPEYKGTLPAKFSRKMSNKNRFNEFPTSCRNVIYLVLLDSIMVPYASKISDFVTRWFCLNCKVISVQFPRRELVSYQGDLATQTVSDAISKRENAFCALGLTAAELHTKNSKRMYGTCSANVGVVSLSQTNFKCAELRLRDVLASVAHELGRIFKLTHCIHSECVMSVHSRNTSLPLVLCRSDMEKLKFALYGCEDAKWRTRELNLRSFYTKHKLPIASSHTTVSTSEDVVDDSDKPRNTDVAICMLNYVSSSPSVPNVVSAPWSR